MALIAQVYVNKEWERTAGLPDALNWSATSFDIGGNILVTGNTVASPGNADILLVKLDDQGEVLWQRTCGGPDGAQDYGVAVTSDQFGNIYLAGVLSNASSVLDMVVLKYAPNGNLLWSQQFNGPANLYDVPSSMALGDDGSIYVAGTTYAASNNPNYLLWKLNVSGVPLWHATYDHAGLIDVATGVLIGSNGNPMVTGGSASSADAWDYATVKFDANTGLQQDIARVTIPGLGLDNALAFTRDNANNVYLTGFREVAGEKDLQTVKLNTAFDVAWVRSYDYEGNDDEARALDTDNAGNLFVCGTVGNDEGGQEIVTIKYDGNGNELWVRRSKPDQGNWSAQGRKVVVTNDGGAVVLGTVYDGTSTNFRTIKYKADGNLEWLKDYDNLTGNEQALDLLLDEDKVYVSGTTQTVNGNGYTTVKYRTTKLENGILFDEENSAIPICNANEVLVKFRSLHVDTTIVANTDWQFGTLGEVIPTALAEEIGQVLGLPSGEGKNIPTYKVFRQLTAKDSTTTTRLGREEPIPAFWNTFKLEVDLGNEPELVAYELNTLPHILEYAHLNHIYQFLGDPYYPAAQEALTPSATYPEGDINIEPAWAITTGRPEVRVGIVDQMIEYWHPDFDTGSSSKVIDGYNYYSNDGMVDLLPEPGLYNTFPHGSACAGVVGAIRDNETGIAGVAGGDADIDNPGCSLYSVEITDHNTGAYPAVEYIAQGIVGGASDADGTDGNFGCHVLNNSYGGGGAWMNPMYDPLLRDAVYFAYRNEVVFVAAKGNGGASPNFPADFTPEVMIVNAGASGRDGQLMTLTNGDGNMSYGNPMDIIAPGAKELITTTVGEFLSFPFCDPYPTGYDCFRGSSSAAAYTSGVAALMLSEHNVLQGYANNLAPEDVEMILQKGATDIIGTPAQNPGYTAGYDVYNGWGRLNAGASVELVHTPYRVFHSGPPVQVDVVSLPAQTINVQSNFGWNYTWGLVDGPHVVIPHHVTLTFEDDLGPNAVIVEGPNGLPGYWGRPSSTVGLTTELVGFANAVWDFDLSGSVLTVTATTTIYEVISGPSDPDLEWVPGPLEKVAAPYSVHLQDLYTVDVQETERPDLFVYPNPTRDRLSATWSAGQVDQLVIIDALGRVVYQSGSIPAHSKRLDVDVEAWASGLYLIQWNGPKGLQATRFVKH